MPLVSDPSFGTGTQLVIDPSEVAVDRTEFPINLGDIKVAEGGPDWGQAQINAATAEAARGELPVDFRIPNRQITIPLLLGGTPGGADFDTQRRYLQAKVGLIQREGGWLKRQDPGKDPVYFDLVNASLTLPDQYGHLNVESGVVLTLDALPDFYGDEQELTLSASSETTLPELTFTVDGIDGDYPGRLRLEVTNDSAADQLGLVACVRSRHYDPADTARLAYQAEDLTPLGQAAVASLAGASGGEVVTHANLGTQWTPVLETNLPAFSSGPEEFLTHKGSYRVRARVYSTSARPPSMRLVWDVGDLVFPEENDPWLIPGASNFYLADLGEIRLDSASVGDHRWQGVIQAKGAVGGENVSIDRVWLEPLDEGHALLRAPLSATAGLNPSVARDEFNQGAGSPLTGEDLSDGSGTWGGAGDTDDFQLSVDYVARTATGDAQPRFVFGDDFGFVALAVQADVNTSAVGVSYATTELGILARYSDPTHHVRAYATSQGVFLAKQIGASFTGIGSGPGNVDAGADLADYLATADTWYTLRLLIDIDGRFALWFFPRGQAGGQSVIQGQDPDLASTGALGIGSVGLADKSASGLAVTRKYDNFLAYVPTRDAVAFAGQSVQLGTDGNFREDATGTAYGPVSIDSGDLLRIPPSGIEGRTVEFMVKPSRGDLDELPDSAIDDVSVRAFCRPSFLTLPW